VVTSILNIDKNKLKTFLIEIEKARIMKTDFINKNDLELDLEILKNELSEIKKLGFIKSDRNEYDVTPKGRELIKIGAIGGVFDFIHLGHIKTLYAAKSRCDLLVVIIARNKTVLKIKKRPPINDENIRKEIVSSLKLVDAAILGDEGAYVNPLFHIEPDEIYLGYDQKLLGQIENLDGLRNRYHVYQLNAYAKGIKTSSIIDRIKKIS